MKRQGNWREKVDPWGLDFLEGYRKASAVRNKLSDVSAWHAKLEEIATEYPQIRVLGQVDVLPDFLKVLLENEQTANLLAEFEPTPGSKTMAEPAARFVEVMQTVTLALEDREMRVLAGFLAGAAALFFGRIYENVSRSNFGDAGPNTKEEVLWVLGMTLEELATILKTGKPTKHKGRVNVELIELIKVLRTHQKAKLTYRELHEALKYAGMHISDEETLRVFEWRARKNGWIKSTEKSTET